MALRTFEGVLRDMGEHPERHRHEYVDLLECCTVDGAVDGRLMEAHEELAPVGMNGGRQCDVTHGPCSCGAWH